MGKADSDFSELKKVAKEIFLMLRLLFSLLPRVLFDTVQSRMQNPDTVQIRTSGNQSQGEVSLLAKNNKDGTFTLLEDHPETEYKVGEVVKPEICKGLGKRVFYLPPNPPDSSDNIE